MKKGKEVSGDSKCIGQRIASGNAMRDFKDLFKRGRQRTLSCLKLILRIHPSISKKVGKFWSVRIGLDHRALAIEDGKDFIWVWIGTHDEYERMIMDKG